MTAQNIGVVAGASIFVILLSCLIGAQVLCSRLSSRGRAVEVSISVPHLVAIHVKVSQPPTIEGDRPTEDPPDNVLDLNGRRPRPHIRAP